MKKIIVLFILIVATVSMVACGTQNNDTSSSGTENQASVDKQITNSTQESKKKVASNDATVQTENKDMPTRMIENGTKINIHFGDTIIPGILNNIETAQALIDMLPYTVHVNKYSHDFCGVMDNPLAYSEENVHYGWLNGDIDFAIDANYFTILFEDEEKSEQYGYQVNIGVIDCELSRISSLEGSYDVLIELAE